MIKTNLLEMTSAAYTFLAGLPAVLGFGAFIFYLFTRNRGPANAISLQTLNLIEQRSGKLPDLDKRLSGKQVFDLVKRDKDLRKVFTPEELALVDGVRKSERRQQWFAFVFLSGTIVLSLVLYLILVWKPWERQAPHPINHFAVDFSFSRQVTPEMQEVWNTLRQKAETAFQTGDRENHFNDGFSFTPLFNATNATGITGTRVTLLPGFLAWNSLREMAERQPPDIGAVKMTMFNASFVFTDSSLPKDMSNFDPKSINSKWDFMVVSELRTTSIPLSLELDFSQNRYRVYSSSYVPVVTGSERWLRTWEELAGLNLVVIMFPLDGAGWNLDFLRFHSELGLQYRINGKDIITHDRVIGPDKATSRIFTCVVPRFQGSVR